MSRSSQSSKLRLFIILLVGSFLAAPAAADIVHSGPVSIPIPPNLDGVYLNVVTGQTGSSSASVAGWDINPYSATGTATHFNLWGALAETWLSTTANIAGPFVLSPGTAIGPGGVFVRPGGSINVGLEVSLNSDQNLFGFRFLNEANGNAIHYGWVRVSFGANLGQRSIVEYAYEDQAGQAIAAGAIGTAPDPIFADRFQSL